MDHAGAMPSSPPPLPADIAPGDILRDTTPVPVEGIAGRYRLDLPHAWRVFYAFGGATMAAAIRSAELELDRDDLTLLSVEATFCQAVPCGPLATAVEVVRSGRRGAQVHVRLWSTSEPSGEVGADLIVTAVFGALNSESPYRMPDSGFPAGVRRPSECGPADASDGATPFDKIPYHSQTDWRQALGHSPWEMDVPSGGDPHSVSWFRFLVPPVLPDGSWEPASLAVPGDMLAPAVVEGVGRENGFFLVVTLQLSMQFFAPMRGEWLCQDTRALHVADGYATGSVNLWSEDATLVASASQTAMLSPFTAG